MNLKILGLTLFTFFASAAAIADYETATGKISQIYVIDNGTNVWGIRIKLEDETADSNAACDEWYVKMSSPMKDQMYSLAVAIQAQGKNATLMKRNSNEDIISSGTICGLHRIYSTH